MSPTRYRPKAAGFAALSWFLGVYLLPLIHNLDHRPDHSHGRPERHEAAHDHGHGHSHGDEGEETDHGDGSVLHFAVAVLKGQAFTFPEPVALVSPIPPMRERRAPSAPTLLVVARGPPSA